MKLLRCASLLLVQTRASRVSAVAYQRRNSALKEAPVERLENGNVQNVYSAVVPPVEKRIPVSLPKNTFVPSGETNHLQRQQWIVQDRLPLPTLLTSEDQNVWKDIPATTLTTSLDHYAKLSKIKLTGLVVLTTLAGFYMGAPGAINYPLLASTLIGTTLTSGSAAAWNHYLEVPFDSQMKRTQDRPLVRGLITPLHAASFAFVSGVTGLTILATCVNPLTAALGGLNLCLYSFIYTPMKRVHIANTWVGAIVGAIPPVMGFTAITNCIDLPSILLGLVLYSWQFPHFNALSWNMRHEYARAGYRMMSVTDPKLCQNTALRHSVFLLGCTTAMCATGMTHWSFGVDTLPFSLYLVYLSYRFRTEPSSQTSRKLFLYSLIYLPVVMFLMVISKNRRSSSNSKKSSESAPAIT